jgi:transcriptional regulator of arginine metabolism
MRKKDRQQIITRLLNEQSIQKQEEFVTILKEQGIEVTQATISRDIKDMKLVKVPALDGGYRYSLPQAGASDLRKKIDRLMQAAVISVDQMDKFVSIKTLPGNAPALANLLEKQYQKELFTVVPMDDKILLIAREVNGAQRLAQTFSQYAE